MIRAFSDAWHRFFFTPQRPTMLAIYRIVFAAIVLLNLFLEYPDWLTWFGEHGLLTLTSLPGRTAKFSLFAIWPHSDAATNALFWIIVVFAIFLLAGLLSRISSVVVFVALLSLHKRNPMILSGGDVLLRLDAFFMMFAPTGAALSVDQLVRRRFGRQSKETKLVLPWAQRMIQIQTTLVYLSTVYWKFRGHTWLDGSALYYVLHLTEFRQFPVPFANNAVIGRVLTWSALATEISLGTIVWVRRARYWVLLAGVCLHSAIEYALNIPLFSLTIVATYLNFVDPHDLDAVRTWMRARWRAPALPG
ncbi:MAG TPA: HTTM domain-containing protein [Bryobacteraceae bacterium]|nr:HTTM domain-containing protein [Bryobacteraceae bacterium]